MIRGYLLFFLFGSLCCLVLGTLAAASDRQWLLALEFFFGGALGVIACRFFLRALDQQRKGWRHEAARKAMKVTKWPPLP
jgi:hypothetical protein